MGPTELRLWIGLALMAACCGLAYAIGDRMVRRTALLAASCWVGVTVLELLSGRQAEPAIAGDVIAGIGLLVLATKGGAAWQWLLVGVQAALMMLPALL